MKTLLTTTALITGLTTAGVQADVIYAMDDFEGEAVGTFATSSNTTSFVKTGNGGTNTAIVDNLASIGDTTNDPTGKHIGVTGNRDKHFSIADAMTLVTDGVESIEIDFKIRFNASGNRANNFGRILYSASGDFSDTELIAIYSATDGTPDVANGVLGENQWYAESVTITPADVGGTFSDTALLRFANDAGGSFNTTVFFDDLTITGIVPEPGSLALLGLGGLLVGARRRRQA